MNYCLPFIILAKASPNPRKHEFGHITLKNVFLKILEKNFLNRKGMNKECETCNKMDISRKYEKNQVKEIKTFV